jgi:hypothetical protein
VNPSAEANLDGKMDTRLALRTDIRILKASGTAQVSLLSNGLRNSGVRNSIATHTSNWFLDTGGLARTGLAAARCCPDGRKCERLGALELELLTEVSLLGFDVNLYIYDLWGAISFSALSHSSARF